MEIPFLDKKEPIKINPDTKYLKLNMVLISQVLYCMKWRMTQKPGKTKTRSLVRGGGRKPWKQKGTGRARAGSIRSPLFVGGSVIFGPTGEKSVKRIPKKMRELAFKQLMIEKIRSKEVFGINSLSVDGKKTREAVKKLDKVQGEIYLVISNKDKEDIIAYRNIPNVSVDYYDDIKFENILSGKKLVISKDALEKFKLSIE